jgi:hypothetical protein
VCSLCAWDRPQRGRHSLHLGCIRFCEETRPANGNNLAQHCATSRRTDFDYALRDLPGMEVGDGTVRRQPLQRIYLCLSSTLRIARSPVCCRPEITSFPGQGDRTTSCRKIACLIGDDVRVIELVEVIHSFDESRQRRCVNQNSGDGSVVANRRFNHRTPQLPRST